MTAARHRAPSARRAADIDAPGLLSPAQTSLLTDQYELAMAASYHRRGMDEPAVFELFVRHLPPHRDWLLVEGLGPALALVTEMRFGGEELAYLEEAVFAAPFLAYLADFRFTGDVDAMPEGTIAFAGATDARASRSDAARTSVEEGPASAVPSVVMSASPSVRTRSALRRHRSSGSAGRPARCPPTAPYTVAFSKDLQDLAVALWLSDVVSADHQSITDARAEL